MNLQFIPSFSFRLRNGFSECSFSSAEIVWFLHNRNETSGYRNRRTYGVELSIRFEQRTQNPLKSLRTIPQQNAEQRKTPAFKALSLNRRSVPPRSTPHHNAVPTDTTSDTRTDTGVRAARQPERDSHGHGQGARLRRKSRHKETEKLAAVGVAESAARRTSE